MVAYWRDRALGRQGDEGKVRKTDLQNQILEAKALEATGHLINRNEVFQVWSTSYMRLGKMLDALPTTFARECGLSTDAVRTMRLHIDEARVNFVRDSAEYLEPEDDTGLKKTA